uniref:Uncharacterized protein n=1 Tax=Pristionchus pacificus TaxID=54126 RepID=A0A2A6BCX3_PRIPA|eukprot:PDM63727.1 hypothetical protein PRIPAC_49700 [Pristionchus pacificus]
MEHVTHLVEEVQAAYDARDPSILPWWANICIGMIIATVFNHLVVDYRLRGALWWRLYQGFYKVAAKFPIYVKGMVQDDEFDSLSELAKAKVDIRKTVHDEDTAEGWTLAIPQKGLTPEEILDKQIKYSTKQANGRVDLKKPDYLNGDVSGAVFNTERSEDEIYLIKEMFGRLAFSNPLWPKIFPDVRKMETEVVSMTIELLHGDKNVCGTMTAGGSMSILQAVIACRNKAFDNGVNWPEM